MARNAVLTPEIKEKILYFYKKNPDVKAMVIRDALLTELGAKVSKGGTWPSLSSVQKAIREFKERPAQSEDQPWSIYNMEDTSVVSAEALPIILQAWVCAREKFNTIFTIRNAKWAGRLRYVLTDIEQLTLWSLRYSKLEIMQEIIPSGPVNATPYDLQLFLLNTGREPSENLYEAIFSPKTDVSYSREKIEDAMKKALKERK